MKRNGLLAAAVLTCLWSAEAPVGACSCIASGPPCEATWQAAAVFAGEVISIQEVVVDRPEIRPEFKEQVRRVTFRVTEPFRGIDAATVIVQTGMGGGDCGYDFSVRQAYLVYAHRYKDRLSAGICSRTRSLAAAAEDLAYLRGPARQPAGLATIQGTARQRDPVSKEYVAWENVPPFAGGRVIVETLDGKPGRKFEATTASDGRYVIQVPAGSYRPTLAVRDGLYATAHRGNIDIPDPRGCSLVDFSVMPDGRIGGRVLTADGQPVGALSVELLRAQALGGNYYGSDARSRTNESGEFEFTRLAPSTYVLGLLMRREAKKDATSIFLIRPPSATPEGLTVAPEERVWAGELPLPESVRLGRVTGVVSSGAGESVSGTKVYVLNAPQLGIAAGPLDVDASGAFSFTVVAGHTYHLSAEQFTPDPERRMRTTRSDVFTAAQGQMSMSLRFDR
jgi:hypothetical protein